MINVLSFKTVFGWITIIEKNKKLVSVKFGKKTQRNNSKYLVKIRNKIIEYSKGRLQFFNIDILFTGTDLQKKIWTEIKNIPYGETKAYSEIATIVKTSPRYVGNVCGQNNFLLLVPCHRVIRSDGSLGGFSGLGGLKLKINYLKWKKMTKNIIILQHIPIETPGFILDLMIKDNFNLTTIELDKGEIIPKDLSKYDAMFCMGGPMDTWMEKEYPWLIEEKIKIKHFVLDLKKPFLGFCLGCQLLGEVVGGKVVKSKIPEIGILDIDLTKEKNFDKLFNNYPNTIKALQWHSYEVVNLEKNKDVTIIGSSNLTKYQIFKYKNYAYGIQFHIEIKENTVSDWGCVPEYKLALEESLGKDALIKFDILAKKNIVQMNLLATKLYNNFKNELLKI